MAKLITLLPQSSNPTKKLVNEASISKLEKSVADLYAWGGIKTKYDAQATKKYGQEVIDAAIKMAPKVLAYEKKIKQMAKDIQDSKEGQILIAKNGYSNQLGGGRGNSSVADLFY
jgi:hypothetical protein